jgi:hypothetical protein
LIAWREGSEEAGGEPKPRPLDLGFSRPLLPWSGNRSIIETAGGWVPAGSVREVLQKPLRRMVMVCG